jgi:hypothetical protein
MPVMRSSKHRESAFAVAGGIVWLALLIAGFAILEQEAFTPAPPTTAAFAFPSHSALALDLRRPTLLLFAHPQCPCTRATLRELDRLRAEAGDSLAVTIVFPLPARVLPGWEKGALWSEANRMPGVRVYRDKAGTETRRFGVTASGHVLVYSTSGRLLFSGGITPSRGHEGDNLGSLTVVRLARGETMPLRETPVFGCALL